MINVAVYVVLCVWLTLHSEHFISVTQSNDMNRLAKPISKTMHFIIPPTQSTQSKWKNITDPKHTHTVVYSPNQPVICTMPLFSLHRLPITAHIKFKALMCVYNMTTAYTNSDSEHWIIFSVNTWPNNISTYYCFFFYCLHACVKGELHGKREGTRKMPCSSPELTTHCVGTTTLLFLDRWKILPWITHPQVVWQA